MPKSTLSRQELYDLVWAHPMRAVAATYGVSDVWLKKICAAAQVPSPDRGYWAKVAAGKPVVKARLPPRDPGMSDQVAMAKPTYRLRYDPEAELAEPLPEPPVFDEPLEAVRERVIKRIGKVVRRRDLSRPCPMVRKLLANDEKRREKHQRSSFPSSWDAPYFESGFELRRLRILNAIGLALPRIGGKLDYASREARNLTVCVGSQVMEILLDHPEAKPNRWGEWSTRPGPAAPLRLELKPRHTEGIPRRLWSDGEDGKLEDQLTDIVVALAMAGEAQYRQARRAHHAWLLQRRAENEAELIRRRAETKRLARERQEKEAAARRELLLGQARDWRTARDIRGFVADVMEAKRSQGAVDAQSLAWQGWALAEADRLAPAQRPLAIGKDQRDGYSQGGSDPHEADDAM